MIGVAQVRLDRSKTALEQEIINQQFTFQREVSLIQHEQELARQETSPGEFEIFVKNYQGAIESFQQLVDLLQGGVQVKQFHRTC